MKSTISDHDLLAYVDGELTEVRREQIRRALADQPNLAARIEELTALGQASRRVVRDSTPQAPQSLRQAIENFDVVTGSLPIEAQAINPLPTVKKLRPWRFALSAIAAAVLLSFTGWFYIQSFNTNTQLPSLIDPTTYSLVEFAEAVTHKHMMCSALEDHFIDPNFPRSVEDLGPAVEKFMAQPVLTPDLASIGYEFAGAGPCHVPGGQTLHLLYQSTDTGDFISLFVQQPPWKIEVDDGHQAIGAGPDADHPMLIWRAGTVMYYLVCDDFGACEKAAKLMGRPLKG